MRYKLCADVSFRTERFGAFAYVHSRNDFFALGPKISDYCQRSAKRFTLAPADIPRRDLEIACQVGLLMSDVGEVDAQSYSGVSLIGLDEVPDASGNEPLVVNCFCTAWCPLKCTYCHADDLMSDAIRDAESRKTAERAVASALSMKPMVYVVTGGDPISAPERALHMLHALGSSGVPTVLDTSGAGDIERLIPIIKRYDVHVRVSIDSFFAINDKLRPLNKKLIAEDLTSRELASRTLKKLISEGIHVTAQTVLTKANGSLTELAATRDGLVRLGVRHWVLHRAVVAGKARNVVESARRKAQKEGRSLQSPPIVPSAGISQVVKDLIRTTEAKNLPIDIRYTHSNPNRNCVVLVGSEGDVYTEGNLKSGKLLLASAEDASRGAFMWNMLNRASHIARYLNCQVPSS